MNLDLEKNVVKLEKLQSSGKYFKELEELEGNIETERYKPEAVQYTSLPTISAMVEAKANPHNLFVVPFRCVCDHKRH